MLRIRILKPKPLHQNPTRRRLPLTLNPLPKLPCRDITVRLLLENGVNFGPTLIEKTTPIGEAVASGWGFGFLRSVRWALALGVWRVGYVQAHGNIADGPVCFASAKST